jgi:hypothetical protein
MFIELDHILKFFEKAILNKFLKTMFSKKKVLKKAICEKVGIDFQSCLAESLVLTKSIFTEFCQIMFLIKQCVVLIQLLSWSQIRINLISSCFLQM